MKLFIFFALSVAMVIGFKHGYVGLGLTTRSRIYMEYIPDGMSKAQWEAIKKKEADSLKGKNLGAVGITKFQSRSFEAFQKSGAKNLFPVDPNAPLNEKPYMQRPGGSPDGADLKAKGLQGVKQAAFQAKTKVDEKYEKLEKAGQLKSTPFSLPWTNEATQKISNTNKAASVSDKTNVSKKGTAPLPTEEAPPKKRFGFF